MANATIVASKANYQFAVGSDIDTLSDPNATAEEKAQANTNLSLLVIQGEAEKTSHHQKFIHCEGKWNVWKQWIDNNPTVIATEVYQQEGKMMDDFG